MKCTISQSPSLLYLSHACHFSVLLTRHKPPCFPQKISHALLHCQSKQEQHLGDTEKSDGWFVIGGEKGMVPLTSTRREGLLALSLALLTPSITITSAQANEVAQGGEAMVKLERYSDKIEGFTLLKPSDWRKVDKAGATVLFEDPDVKTNNIGVVVNPIRITSLKEFGTPQDVANKLLQAEKKKPSTNDAQLIRVEQRPIHGDIPLYELEYSLDSTRGIKRVLSAVTVASKKLYLLNISYSDSPEKPLLPNIRMVLEQVLDSFDVVI